VFSADYKRVNEYTRPADGATPPENTSLPTITGTAQQSQRLTERLGSWTNQPTSHAYRWLQCDARGSSCLPIAGATTRTYWPIAGDVGHTLRVQETASNAGGTCAPAASPQTAVVTPPAQRTTAPHIMAGAEENRQRMTELGSP